MTTTAPVSDVDALPTDNPFREPTTLPYGLPDFAAIRTEHLLPAITTGLAEQRAQWEQVATDPHVPTVANTLEALERSGALLGRAARVFYTLLSSVGGEELDAIAAQLAPLRAAHNDAFTLDARLFARYEGLHARRHELDEESAWLVHVLRTQAIQAGVRLDEGKQSRLRELNARLTELETEFGQRVVAGMGHAAVHITDDAQLAGLSAESVAGLARAAADRGLDGHLATLILPTSQPLLAQASDRGLRERAHLASVRRGTGVDPDSDTRETLLELARLRAERAALLGYPHHAAYVAEQGTAKTSEAVLAMLHRLAGPAFRNALIEAAELEELLGEDVAVAGERAESERLRPWDWPFYADRVRATRYDVDPAALKGYFELGSVLRNGVFFAATRLYGLAFTEREDLVGYAPGVRVWEVSEADGTGLGLFVGDFYSREHKRGGAWMNSFVDQSHLLDQRPVVLNNLNLTPPPEGEPTLLTWDEVITCFHEFGHALHGLLSDVRYPSLSGTAVPRDFVEFPSQVNEIWASHPAVLANYARHHRTGEVLDSATIERLIASQGYGEGFATTEYLGAALLDQAWHVLTPEEVPASHDDVEAFEARALAEAGIDPEVVPPRYRSTYFNHTFGGGYDAGYYSYIWSEVLDADTVDWFREGPDGGLDRERGDRFRRALLARGHAVDPLAAYRGLRGRDALIEPLLLRRGLAE